MSESTGIDVTKSVGTKWTEKRTWEEFRASGLLWFVNRTLQLFGWAIACEVWEDGSVGNVYPMRVRYRGFDQDSEEEGFKKVSAFIRENVEDFEKDCYLESGAQAPETLQSQIGAWGDETFGQSTPESVVCHLRKEFQEFLDDGSAEEAADVVTLLMHYAHKKGFDLETEIRAKFEINKNRTWGEPDADGVVEHVREEQLCKE